MKQKAITKNMFQDLDEMERSDSEVLREFAKGMRDILEGRVREV